MQFVQRDTSKPLNMNNPFIQGNKHISVIQRPVKNQLNPFRGKLFSGKISQPSAISRSFNRIKKKTNPFLRETLGLDDIFKNALNVMQYETTFGPINSPTSGAAPIGRRQEHNVNRTFHHRKQTPILHDLMKQKASLSGQPGQDTDSRVQKKQTYGLNKKESYNKADWTNAGIGK